MSVTANDRNTANRSGSRNAITVRRGGGAAQCNRCRALIHTDEPLCLIRPGWSTGWTYYVASYADPTTGDMYRGRIVKDRGGMCTRCACIRLVHPGLWEKDSDVHLRRYREAACDWCGRLVIKEAKLMRKHAFCSPVCEERYYNRRRRERNAAAREKPCETCGEPFTATRRDAKTCSPACKQKAYRLRKKGE